MKPPVDISPTKRLPGWKQCLEPCIPGRTFKLTRDFPIFGSNNQVRHNEPNIVLNEGTILRILEHRQHESACKVEVVLLLVGKMTFWMHMVDLHHYSDLPVSV